MTVFNQPCDKLPFVLNLAVPQERKLNSSMWHVTNTGYAMKIDRELASDDRM
jgi:hypothetical protein